MTSLNISSVSEALTKAANLLKGFIWEFQTVGSHGTCIMTVGGFICLLLYVCATDLRFNSPHLYATLFGRSEINLQEGCSSKGLEQKGYIFL